MTEPQPEQPIDDAEAPDPRPFIIGQLGLDESFLEADDAQKEAMLAELDAQLVRRFLVRALIHAVLVTAFVLQLTGTIVVVTCGIVALLAGRDLARFNFMRRLIAFARAEFLGEGLEA